MGRVRVGHEQVGAEDLDELVTTLDVLTKADWLCTAQYGGPSDLRFRMWRANPAERHPSLEEVADLLGITIDPQSEYGFKVGVHATTGLIEVTYLGAYDATFVRGFVPRAEQLGQELTQSVRVAEAQYQSYVDET